ncbi:MAG: hypothetical protein GY899_02225 [Verrucomicrobiaceae bacterium]|nr:hypothetical protein [Verrucomicrobiaceae bacterium]
MKRLLFFSAAIVMAYAQENPVNETRESPVGLYREIRNFVLPGSILETKPIRQDTEIIVRINAVRPHGSSFRYDLSYCGLEAGEFNLSRYLQRKDGTSAEDLPILPVRFDGALPAGRLQPNKPIPGNLPRIGGYRTLLIAAGVIWILSPLVLLLLRSRKRQPEISSLQEPETIADRMHPLLQAARDGRLDTSGQAELERALIGFWRERLNLHGESPATALAKIREHKDAAILLEQLERWLHKPNSQSPVDLDSLLDPYRQAIAETKEKD